MSCEYKKDVASIPDGTLSGVQVTALRAHIAGCPECAAELRAVEQTHLLLKQLKPDAAPDGIEQTVMQKVMKLHTAGKGINPLYFAIPLMTLSIAVFSYFLFTADVSGFSSSVPFLKNIGSKYSFNIPVPASEQLRQTVFFSVLFFVLGSCYLLYERYRPLKHK